jgi:hypothetical protein
VCFISVETVPKVAAKAAKFLGKTFGTFLLSTRLKHTHILFCSSFFMEHCSSTLGVYQRITASQVLTLDVPANQPSMSVINRYLELKGRMQL